MGRHDPAIGTRGGHGLAELTAPPRSSVGENFRIIRRMSDSLKTSAPKGYVEPVAGLLGYGSVESRLGETPWPNYLELGFADEHVPDLIRMAMDGNFNSADGDSVEVWGPLHAWRTLAQLRAVEAVEPLLQLLENLPCDEWLSGELPKVFSLIGPAAIPVLADFINDNDVDEGSRISVPSCLERIAQDHPECRDECIGKLASQLTLHETNGSELNAFIIWSLIELKATGAINNIRTAYSADCVELGIVGDVEDVEIAMGLRQGRDTPRPKYNIIPGLDDLELDAGQDLDSGNIPRNIPLNGVTNPLRHVGRNDPCPCGSGKKFKKCCLQ